MVLARIYIVRHGETEENRKRIIQGQMDTVLNELGFEQAKKAGEALADISFDFAFTSDLARAVQTAETILAQHPNVQLEKSEMLRERNFGEAQGQSASFLSDPLPPSAETIAEFTERAAQWWNKTILQKVLSSPGPSNVLVVSHGAFIHTALVSNLVNSRKVACAPGIIVLKWGCVNASITIIEIDEHKEATLVQSCDTAHLKGQDLVTTNADQI